MKLRAQASSLALVVCTLTGSAFAWGPDGHRTVCQIAFLRLDAAHKAAVTRLAKSYKAPDGARFTSFAQGCTFPDDARGKAKENVAGYNRFHKFDNWHFFNVPRTATVVTEDACHDDCVLKGIAVHSAALKDAANQHDRAEALFFIGHWLGDIQQPLHISYADDLGGNQIQPIHGGVYKASNLHSVWDSGIIANDMGDVGWKAFATRLNKAITPAKTTAWLGGTSVDWAEESYKITVLPDVKYCKENAANTACEPDHPTLGRTLQAPYQHEFQDRVETRLEQAGVRLANIIQSNLPMH